MTSEHILDRILQAKVLEVAASRAAGLPVSSRGQPRDFASALRGPGLRLIAEIKRASPSRGTIRPGLDPAALAREYERGGAAAVSVLTDRQFFGGALSDLALVRRAVGLPLLRKDFIIDPWQLEESVAAGADAVLLIARLLGPEQLAGFLEDARQLELAALVEVHDEADLERALDAGARLVGINNRDLATFQVDLGVTARLRPLVPPAVTVVAESGISQPAHAAQLRRLGVHAMLVGEALVRSEHPAQAVRRLLAGEGEP